MPVELDPIKIEDFAFLELGAPPDGSERRQPCAIRAIFRAQSNDHRAMLQRHREEVIDRFEITGKKFLLCFFNFFLHSLDNLFYLHLFRDLAVEPIDASHIRAVIQFQSRIVAKELRYSARVRVID